MLLGNDDGNTWRFLQCLFYKHVHVTQRCTHFSEILLWEITMISCETSGNLSVVTTGTVVAESRRKEKAFVLEWFCRETCLHLTQWKNYSRRANLYETMTPLMLLEAVKTVKIYWIKCWLSKLKLQVGISQPIHPPTYLGVVSMW